MKRTRSYNYIINKQKMFNVKLALAIARRNQIQFN